MEKTTPSPVDDILITLNRTWLDRAAKLGWK